MNDLTILLIVLLVVVLLWRGPRMLPRLGEALGSAVRGARRTVRDSFDRDARSDSTQADAGPERR